MKKYWLGTWLVTGLFVLTASVYGEVPGQVGECGDCHGADGISSKENVPSIAGVSVGVLADYLYAYKEGTRVCGDAGTQAKCSIKAKLSDEQIEELAEYFAGLQYRALEQPFDAKKAAAGSTIHAEHCDKCHSDGGSNPDDDAGILAGQPIAYLKAVLAQYASGKRDQPSSMERKISGLSEADLEALAHYYASQQ